MKNILILLGISLFISLKCAGQQRDTLKSKQGERERMARFFAKRLNVDSAKAEKVALIQANYKTAFKKIAADSTLTFDRKRQALDSVARQKNRQLESLLSPEEQEKIIPGKERVTIKVKQTGN